MARSSTAASKPAKLMHAGQGGELSRDEKLELYYYMRLTRSLEVAAY